jgi:hypothetical protein
MQAWEYAVAFISANLPVHIMMSVPEPDLYIQPEGQGHKLKLIHLLNQMGREGWELVSALDGDDGLTTMYFKRPLE